MFMQDIDPVLGFPEMEKIEELLSHVLLTLSNMLLQLCT